MGGVPYFSVELGCFEAARNKHLRICIFFTGAYIFQIGFFLGTGQSLQAVTAGSSSAEDILHCSTNNLSRNNKDNFFYV